MGYAYDRLGRLTAVTYPDGATTSYRYDPMGNRTEMVDGSGITTYAYDTSDRLLSTSGAQNLSFNWDPRGNQTGKGGSVYGYDGADRLASVTTGAGSAGYSYNGEGVRVGETVDETVDGTATSYLQDQAASLPRVMLETSAGQETLYVWGLGLVYQVNGDGTRRYYHADALGSTRVVTDDAGVPVAAISYDAYGSVRAQAGEGRSFTFTGEQLDTETNMVFLRARYYDPETGRFASRDSFPGQMADPGSVNRYTYAQDNPLKYIDPMGHFVLFVGGMNTNNDEDLNSGAWDVMMEQLQLDPTHQTGEEWAFFNWGNEPQASNLVPMEIAASRLQQQIAGKTDIKLIGHSRGGALVMEYSAEVAEERLGVNEELKGVYSIDGALNPANSLIRNPIADERFAGGIGPFLRTDRYANLPERFRQCGINADMATFDNKADWPFTTHAYLPGMGGYEWRIDGQGSNIRERFLAAHGVLQKDPLVGQLIRNRSSRQPCGG